MGASIWNVSDAPQLPATTQMRKQAYTASAGQTVFTLTEFTYVPGTDTLLVFVNGVLQLVGVDFSETSSSVVTFTSPLELSDSVVVLGLSAEQVQVIQAVVNFALLASGSAASPSLSFAAAPSTGLHLLPDGTIAISMAGVDRAYITPLGKLILGANVTAPTNVILQLDESLDAVSNRAAMQIGLGWLVGQDVNADGTRDFFIYDVATGVLRFVIKPGGVLQLVSGDVVMGPLNTPARGALTVAKNAALGVEQIVENLNTGANTTKFVATAYFGRDTINTAKPVGACYMRPLDNNWVGSYIALSAREADALIDYFYIGPNGVHVVRPVVFGYAAGAGGVVLQDTSKSTAVTIDKPCGQITTHNESIPAAASKDFRVNNNLVTTSSVVTLSFVDTSAHNYEVSLRKVGVGYFIVRILNAAGVSDPGENLFINFKVSSIATS